MTRPRALVVVAAAAAVLTAMNLSVWLAGASPSRVLALMFAGTLGSSYGFAQSLAKATPLLWTGAAVALALRARLFNIGAEGQCLAGVLAAAVVGAALPASTPALVAVPCCLLAAAGGGAALGGFAGWLRGRLGTNEVLSTLMLNGLMAVVVTWLYGGPLRDGAQVHTRDVVAGARLPMAGAALRAFRGSGLNASFLLGLVALAAMGWYLDRTRGGLRIRALGSSSGAAAALGIDPLRTTVRAMALSGALAGLAASHLVLGVKGYAEHGLGAGVGFTGIAVALLGGGKPLGIALAAVLFGLLAQGSLAVNAVVPSDALVVVQAATLVAVAVVGAGRAVTR
ncbi:MAG: ABC transporter permease [Deltaproteobacteria bacterium]|nr:ABC transporter permease [Myxococcales bacterium]MDP3218994.1 ABC transporter permease [Deltaproteobacteria bacterium]